MRAPAILLSLLVLVPTLVVAAEGGVNEESSLMGTDIEGISHEIITREGVPFDISVRLSEEADKNGTTVNWVTQICINSGVCYPPAIQPL